MTIDIEQLREAYHRAWVARLPTQMDLARAYLDLHEQHVSVLQREAATTARYDARVDALQADLQATQQRETDANKRAMKHLRRAEKSEIAAGNYANFSHEWRQRFEKAEAERDALHEQNRKLREALGGLLDAMDAVDAEAKRAEEKGGWSSAPVVQMHYKRLAARAALAEGETE